MRLLGTGVDLVEVQRFEKTVRRLGNRFLTRVFTPEELKYAKERKTMMQHLAARFAAKEAVVKALGAPKGLGLKWKDLEITRTPAGKPQAVFKGSMARWKKYQVHLSLTHTHEHAIATAIVL